MSNNNNIPLFEVTSDLKEHELVAFGKLPYEKISDSVGFTGKATYRFKGDVPGSAVFGDILDTVDVIELKGNHGTKLVSIYGLAAVLEDDEEISLHFESYCDDWKDVYTYYDKRHRIVRFSKETLEKTYDLEEKISTYSAVKNLHKKSKAMI